MPYWLGFILIVFSVLGLYFLFTLFLGAFFGENTYTPTINGDGLSLEELMVSFQAAKRSVEAAANLSGTPIVLFSVPPPAQIAEMLRENEVPFAVFM